MKVNDGQIEYEFLHLLRKLEIRDVKRFHELKEAKEIKTFALFEIQKGDIEKWEMI